MNAAGKEIYYSRVFKSVVLACVDVLPDTLSMLSPPKPELSYRCLLSSQLFWRTGCLRACVKHIQLWWVLRFACVTTELNTWSKYQTVFSITVSHDLQWYTHFSAQGHHNQCQQTLSMVYMQVLSIILGSGMSFGFYNLYSDCKTYFFHIQI